MKDLITIINEESSKELYNKIINLIQQIGKKYIDNDLSFKKTNIRVVCSTYKPLLKHPDKMEWEVYFLDRNKKPYRNDIDYIKFISHKKSFLTGEEYDKEWYLAGLRYDPKLSASTNGLPLFIEILSFNKRMSQKYAQFPDDWSEHEEHITYCTNDELKKIIENLKKLLK